LSVLIANEALTVPLEARVSDLEERMAAVEAILHLAG
jgi:hypothetical protein